MVGAMKGLNDMKNNAGFKVGDKVAYLYIPGGIKKLKGRMGVVKMTYEDACSVTFKSTEKYLTPETYAIDNKYLSKIIGQHPDTDFTPREKANDKDNVWAISIQPAPFDRERAVADLIVNGRIVDTVTVSRWHDEDEYDVGAAAYEAVKKLFDIKDKTAKDIEKNTPLKYYTGKVFCTRDTDVFTKGKIYEVNNGNIVNDEGDEFVRFESFEELNECPSTCDAEFIEVAE